MSLSYDNLPIARQVTVKIDNKKNGVSRRYNRERERQQVPPLISNVFVIGVFVILALSSLNAFFGERGLFGYWSLRNEHASLSREVRELTAGNRRLENEILALRTNPFVIERHAREILGMTYPKEFSLRIIRQNTASNNQ